MGSQHSRKLRRQSDNSDIQNSPQIKTRPFDQEASLQTKPINPSANFRFDQVNSFTQETRPASPLSSSLLQTKLTIGEPGDKYEKEADNVAKAVVQQINTPQAQREDEIQRSSLTISPLLQRKSSAPVGPASDDFEKSLSNARNSGSTLEPKIQSQMESAMGADFSGVKVHTDNQADQLSRSIQAKAFTTGNDVFFKQGEYNPNSRGGQELLAHELTHVIQQGAGIARTVHTQPMETPQSAGSLLQAKLMTGSELEKLTGVKRRSSIVRGFKALGGKIKIGSGGSSYDDILGLLEKYEKLEESDTEGKEKAKRLAILTDTEKKIFAWYNSKNRKHDDNGEVIESNSGDSEKIAVLQELMYQVTEERDTVAAMSDGIESGIEKTKKITSDSNVEDEKSKTEIKAENHKQEQKSFFSKVGEKIGKAWHYTFGKEFYPTGVVPLHMDFVSEYDVMRSAELLEVALDIERKLLAEGVEPLKAMSLAYQYLPVQLRPRSPEPYEKVVLKVKLQIFKESLTQKKEEGKEMSEKVKKVSDIGSKVSSGYGVGVTGLEKLSVITKEVAESNTGINKLIGSITDVVSSFANIFTLLSKSTKPENSDTEQSQIEEQAGLAAIDILSKITAVGDKVNTLKSGDDATPILGILSSVFSVVQNLLKGAKLLIRYIEEGKLNKDPDAKKSGLLAVLERTSKRSRSLAISAGTEIIIAALNIVGSILGPSGTGAAAVKIIANVIKYGKKAVEHVESSYTAGLSQEAQIESESGIEGSSKKVLESSDKWGITAIILEAKDGNKIAIKKLELFGVKPKDIDSMEVEKLRKVIMDELEREENAKTLTQKLTGKSVKG